MSNKIIFIVLSFLCFDSFSSSLTEKKEDQKRKWSVGFSHGLSRGAYYEAKTTTSNSLSISYKYKEFNLSVRSSYVYPLGFVSDTSYFGLTDTSFGAAKSLKFMEGFLDSTWSASVGLVLPTAKRSRKKGKYSSLFGRISYSRKFKDFFTFGLSHILHTDLNKYQTDRAGTANRLASSSHEIHFNMKIKKLSLSGGGNFYLYSYLADLDPDPNVSDTKLKFKAYQGGNLSLSYLIWKKSNLRLNMGWSINVPVVSYILTGFPAFDKRYWLYNVGLSWAI